VNPQDITPAPAPAVPTPIVPPAAVNGASQAKDVYTTGEAAEICKVSQQTIIRCFDAGRLGGFRVPGSKFRRIPRDALVKFMKDNQIPYGKNAEEIILDAVKEYKFPVCFNFPAGHIENNYALPLGRKASMDVGEKSKLDFI